MANAGVPEKLQIFIYIIPERSCAKPNFFRVRMKMVVKPYLKLKKFVGIFVQSSSCKTLESSYEFYLKWCLRWNKF